MPRLDAAAPASSLASAEADLLHRRIRDWFAASARDLPWRRPECDAWGILVSEFMLQQTPVVRVLPVWEQWMQRWPRPADLAADSAGEAVRAWGRLGYPRRALRLHAAATAIVERHGGRVPDDHGSLLELPGVGTYTAAAVASFAFGLPETVVDTNIRRVHARLVTGAALPAPALTAAEMRLAQELMPASGTKEWNAGAMELGALVCTARAPRCDACPVLDRCAWVAAGRPEPHYVPKGQAWAGTDRQVRGAMMAVLREAESSVPREVLLGSIDLAALPAAYHKPLQALRALPAGDEQLGRALDGLLADGLAVTAGSGISLPA
ncbi:A/G-specific adenine glycosylase [Arthrobacter sulfonylureivorans]|uniref:A/G-specific adenine glycosylase n=1 Tax=Arthrobacter sulfonylureivorans TaxID=2486855 RepID=UPI0039E2B37F